jgi:hypothetical protein
MANFSVWAGKHRDQSAITLGQGWIRVDVDISQDERISWLEFLQGRPHVVTQVTSGAAVEGEFFHLSRRNET